MSEINYPENKIAKLFPPIKTGLWFTLPTLCLAIAVVLICIVSAWVSPRHGVFFIVDFPLYGVLPMLFTFFTGATVGRKCLGSRNKTLRQWSGLLVSLLAGIGWFFCYSICDILKVFRWEAGMIGTERDVPGAAVIMGQFFAVSLCLAYITCEIGIGILLSDSKEKLVADDSNSVR